MQWDGAGCDAVAPQANSARTVSTDVIAQVGVVGAQLQLSGSLHEGKGLPGSAIICCWSAGPEPAGDV